MDARLATCQSCNKALYAGDVVIVTNAIETSWVTCAMCHLDQFIWKIEEQ